MEKVPPKLDYAAPTTARRWPWWFHLYFAIGIGLLLIDLIVVPMLAKGDAYETVFGIPSKPVMLDLLILAVAVFAKLGWEIYKWYGRVESDRETQP